MVWPISVGLADSLPPAWNGKGLYMDKWVPVSVSSPSRTSHSTSATTSSNYSSSSSLSLPVSSPRSYACNFCSFFFLLNSFVFFCHLATVRFAIATSWSFGSRVRLSPKMSLFGWYCYPEVSIKGPRIQVKRRHRERELTKSMNPGSGRIGGCPGTGYTKSRTTPTLSFEGSIASLMRCATLEGERFIDKRRPFERCSRSY